MARAHVLETEQLVRRSRREVFAFFAQPENLDAITPDDLRFEILTPRPIAMRAGALLQYRLRLAGVSFRWVTRIEAFEPEERFVDVQLRGPYRSWRHTHAFIEVPEGTRVRDRVEYALPLGPLGALAHALFVRRRLEQIFAHRRRRIAELLDGGAQRPAAGTSAGGSAEGGARGARIAARASVPERGSDPSIPS